MSVRVLGVVLLLALVAACGGGDDGGSNSTPEPGTEENRLAGRMRLGIEDFSGEWRHDNFGEEFDEDPFDECETSDEGVTGRAETGDFSNGLLNGYVSEHIFVFETAAQAAANLQQMDEREDCVLEVLDSGRADTSRVTFSDAVREESEKLDFGEGTASFRVSATATPLNTGSLSGVGTIYADFLYVVVGRAGLAVLGSDDFDPISQVDLEDFTQMAVEKVADELGVDVADPRGERPSDTPEPPSGEPGEHSPEPTEREQASPVKETIALGESGTIHDRMQVSVVAVNFDAEEVILEENQFNDPAAPGNRMILVSLDVTNVGSAELDPYFDPEYKMIGANGFVYRPYDPSCGVIPDEFQDVLTEGESVQGNVCFQVEEDEAGLVLVIKFYSSGAFDDAELYLALE